MVILSSIVLLLIYFHPAAGHQARDLHGHIQVVPWSSRSRVRLFFGSANAGVLQIYADQNWTDTCKDNLNTDILTAICGTNMPNMSLLNVRHFHRMFYYKTGSSYYGVLAECHDYCRNLEYFVNWQCFDAWNAPVVMCDRDTSGSAHTLLSPVEDSNLSLLQVSYNGLTLNLCDRNFTMEDLHVLRRSAVINRPTALSWKPPWLGLSWSPECTGREHSLLDCKRDYKTGCSAFYNEPPLLLPNNVLQQDGPAPKLKVQRLLGGGGDGDGSEISGGRLLVSYYGDAGYVCVSGFNSGAAKVVCRALGHNSDFAQVLPTQLTDDVYTASNRWRIACHGWETELNQCHYTRRPGVCNSTQGIAVICPPHQLVAPFSWRLVGGATSMEGRVEMTFAGYPGSVCIGNEYGNKFAMVMCRYLGYSRPGYSDIAVPVARFGAGLGIIWISGIFCTGSESTPIMCPHNEIGSSPCTRNGRHELAIQCAVGYIASMSMSMMRTATARENTGSWSNRSRITKSPDQSLHNSIDKRPGLPWVALGVHTHSHGPGPFSYTSHFQMINIDSDIHTGVVDMKVASTWRYVCDKYGTFDDKAAKVFCRSIGQPSISARRMYSQSQTATDVTIISWSMSVKCKGNELSLLSCQHDPIEEAGCSPQNIAIVNCSSGGPKDDNSNWITFTLAAAALLVIIVAGCILFVALRRYRSRDQSRHGFINEDDIANDYIPPKYEELFPELQPISQPGTSQEQIETMTSPREQHQENHM